VAGPAGAHLPGRSFGEPGTRSGDPARAVGTRLQALVKGWPLYWKGGYDRRSYNSLLLGNHAGGITQADLWRQADPASPGQAKHFLLGTPDGAGPAQGAVFEAVLRRQGMGNKSIIVEFWEFLRLRKRYWLLPILVALLLLGGLIVFTETSAVAPFIYTLF